MPVPSNISDLSTTPADNSPPGTESPSTADDYLRTHAAFIAQLDDADAAHVAAADPHSQYQLKSGVSGYATDSLDNVDPATGRTALGLGTASTHDVGTRANNVVRLDASAKLPAVDGSALTNLPIPTSSYAGGRGQVFTSSGTFTVPTGVTAIKVRGCSGGGGGGSAAGSSNGGTTSFGSYCSATGGKSNSNGGAGGVATGGAININGGGGTTTGVGLCGVTGLFGGGQVAGSVTGHGNGCYHSGSGPALLNGGGGGYFERYITDLTPSDTIAVTIGAGGSGSVGSAKGVAGICIVEW